MTQLQILLFLQETCLRPELPLLMATTPISASAEDAAGIQVCSSLTAEERRRLCTILPFLIMRCNTAFPLFCVGVATYCKDSATPFAAEEGLSGVLTSYEGATGCYGDQSDFCRDELQLLDNEGRAIVTQHNIMYDRSMCCHGTANCSCPSFLSLTSMCCKYCNTCTKRPYE